LRDCTHGSAHGERKLKNISPQKGFLRGEEYRNSNGGAKGALGG